MNELALFAGAGGGILGGKLLGWRTVCAVEIEPYAASVLMQRQNDGILDPFPIWDDICTFDGRPWQGVVDVVSGGFPCQDISVAGKGAGLDGERSGLWSEMARIIGEVRPLYVLVENSPALTVRGLGRVLGDLAALGYDAEWGVLGAVHAGAPHKRERIWIVAYSARVSGDKRRPKSERQLRQTGIADGGNDVADAKSSRTGNVRQNNGPGCDQINTFNNSSCPCGRDDKPFHGKDVANTNEIGRKRRPWVFGQSGRHELENGCSDPDTDSSWQLQPQGDEQEQRRRSGDFCVEVPGALRTGCEELRREAWWATEPGLGGVVDGLACWLELA